MYLHILKTFTLFSTMYKKNVYLESQLKAGVTICIRAYCLLHADCILQLCVLDFSYQYDTNVH